jgi:hypothetical protein
LIMPFPLIVTAIFTPSFVMQATRVDQGHHGQQKKKGKKKHQNLHSRYCHEVVTPHVCMHTAT